jgi:hypothetical protein
MISSMCFAIAMMLLAMASLSEGFQVPKQTIQPQAARAAHAYIMVPHSSTTSTSTSLEMVFGRGNNNKKKNSDEETFIPGKKMNVARRKKLGVNDDEEEYDLEMALDNSTDPLITKIIAGSLILSILTLLIFGLVIPATTDYGNACNPLLTGGRC